MRRLIKKILRESELGWIMDSNPIYDNDYYIDIRGLDKEEKCKLQQIILDFGFEWDMLNPYKINQQACSDSNVAYTLYPTGKERRRIYRSPSTFEELGSPDWMVYLTHQQFLDLVGRSLND